MGTTGLLELVPADLDGLTPEQQAEVLHLFERELTLASPAAFATRLSHGLWLPYRHLVYTSNRIVAMIEDDACDCLIVEEPVRMGKTELCSRWTPAWFICKYRGRVLLTSYEADFAATHGRRAREIVAEHGSRFGVQIDDTSRAAHRWELADGTGGMVCAGAGGPITGKGGNLLVCLTGDTVIETNRGPTRLDSAHRAGQEVTHVQSWDHAGQRIVAAPVTSVQLTGYRDDIHEIVTVSGRRLTCTRDHRVYVEGRGYTEAHLLRPGWRLRVMSGVRHEDQAEEQDVSRLLSRSPTVASALPLCRVRFGGHVDVGRLPQASQPLLLPSMRGHRLSPGSSLRLRSAQSQGSEVLLASVRFRSRRSQEVDGSTLPAMPDHVPAAQHAHGVLLTHLRGQSPLDPHDGEGEQSLQPRTVVHVGLPSPAPSDHRHRRWLRGMRHFGAFARSSHRSRPHEQPSRESRDAVQVTSRGSSQISYDTVALVRPIRTEPLPVYDLTVAHTANFFANGILVHNCDDPIKNAEEANSPVMREHLWQWWGTTFLTRREPGAKIILICSRWHDDDVVARVIANETDLRVAG